MTSLDGVRLDDEVMLSRDELHLLRFTCELSADEESPLGPVRALEDEGALEHAARSLIARGLVDVATLRPHREVVRRLLIVSRPDARVVLMRSDGGGARRELDLYQRAGAFVPYKRRGERHVLGKPRDFEAVAEEVLRALPTRRSFGDYVDFSLGPTEYFAFSLLAGDLAGKVKTGAAEPDADRSTIRNLGLGPGGFDVPLSVGLGDEGTPIHQLLSKLPVERGRSVPGRQDWDRAIAALLDKELITRHGDGYRLRPFLHDLAIGLALRHRVVLTRFDFGADDWIVRDATLVPVPGSLFLVRAVREGAIRIVELDKDSVGSTVRFAIEDLAVTQAD